MDIKNIKEKIFVIGLSRTGTTSLCSAFKTLGLKANHYPWGLKRISESQVSTDIPVVMFWMKGILEAKWPNSRYILTYRDHDEWVEESKKFWEKWPPGSRTHHSLKRYSRKVHEICYGSNEYEKGLYEKAYHRHNVFVREYYKDAPEKMFLEMNICAGDGWEKLCNWLNIEAPSSPFPFLNSIEKHLEDN